LNDKEYIKRTNQRLARKAKMRRSLEMQKKIDSIAKKTFGESLSEAHEKKICVQCKKQVGEILDTIERREYEISGLCPFCQREYFD